MADPIAALDPFNPSAPPMDPNAIPGLVPQVSPVVQPGLGVPTAALDAGIASPVPWGPDNPPPWLAQPQNANGQTALPDVSDNIGVAPDGSGGPGQLDPNPVAQPPGWLDAMGNAIGDAGRAVGQGIIGLPETLGNLSDNLKSQAAGESYGILNPLTTRIESHEESFSGHPLDNPNSQEAQDYLAKLSLTDPIAYAGIRQNQETAKALQISAMQLDDAQKNADAIARDQAIKAAAVAKANASLDQLNAQAAAVKDVDPNRWWNTRSAGQKFASLIGAIAGGVAQGQTPGSRNMFLDDMQKSIDQDIDAQKFNITNARDKIATQRGIVAEIYRNTGDLYQAGEAARIASWQQAISTLQSRAQMVDPKGTAAVAYADAIQAATGKLIANQNAYHQQDIENNIKALTAGTTVRKVESDIAHQKVQENQDAQRIGLDAARVGLEKRQQDLTALNEEANRQAAADRAKEALEAKKGEGLLTIGGDVSTNPDGSVKFNKLVQDTGDAWQVPKDEAPKVSAILSAADSYNRVVNDVIRLSDEWGHVSNIKKGAVWQQIKSKVADLKILGHKAAGIEGFKGGVVEIVDQMNTAGMDPNSFFHDVTPALRNGRDDLNANVTDVLRRIPGDGYTGAAYNPIDTSRPNIPQETVDESRLKSTLGEQDRDVGITDKLQAAASLVTPGLPVDPEVASDMTAAMVGGVNRQSTDALAAWSKDIGGKDLKLRDSAAKNLYQTMIHGGSPGVRSAAHQAIVDSGFTILPDKSGVGKIVKLPGDDTEGARENSSRATAQDENAPIPAPEPKKKGK